MSVREIKLLIASAILLCSWRCKLEFSLSQSKILFRIHDYSILSDTNHYSHFNLKSEGNALQYIPQNPRPGESLNLQELDELDTFLDSVLSVISFERFMRAEDTLDANRYRYTQILTYKNALNEKFLFVNSISPGLYINSFNPHKEFRVVRTRNSDCAFLYIKIVDGEFHVEKAVTGRANYFDDK